jgi:glycosyltransferase involved in cell wall biosynthesis
LFNIYYLGNPVHGGYVTFNAHLLYNLKRNVVLKVSDKSEDKVRSLGWGKYYQNVSPDSIANDDNYVISALEKSHYHFFDKIKNKNIILITHDTVELKKEAIELIRSDKWKVIAIRRQISNFLKQKYDIPSKFIKHPFHPPKFTNRSRRRGATSISRIHFDKHTEIMIQANKLIKDDKDKIQIYGQVDQIYSYRTLNRILPEKQKPFHKNYPFYIKPLVKSFEFLKKTLSHYKFVIDMSMIKNDGGGTQYTFLEAIHYGCALILHSKWILENKKDNIFRPDYNCLVVDNAKELAELAQNKKLDTTKITDNARKILKDHAKVDWQKEIVELLYK